MENKQIIEKLHDLTKSADTEFKENIRIIGSGNDDIALLCLYQRMINNLNSVEYLVKGDFLLEAIIIMRSMIENTLVINALFYNPTKTLELLDKLTNYNFKKMNKTVQEYPEFKEAIQKFDFSKFESRQVGPWDYKDLAPANNDLYKISYGILCNEVHINYKSINNYIKRDGEKNFGILNKPKNNNFEIAYYTIFYCFSLIYQELSKRYNININEAAEIDLLIENLL